MSFKVGIIGLGNMGGTLAKCLLSSGAVKEEDLIVTNRSSDKVEALQSEFFGINVGSDNSELVRSSDMIFICVKTPQVPDVLFEIRPELDENKHIVLINGGVQLKHVAGLFAGPVSKMIPSMTLGSGKGVSLLCHHERVDEKARKRLEEMTALLCPLKMVKEDQFEVMADLTSCAPAFVAEFANQFAEAGCRHGDIEQVEARELVLSMLLGTSMMLTDHSMTIEEMKTKVATKGGITEQGLNVMDQMLPKMFDRMFAATMSKHAQVKSQIASRFEGAR